MKSYDFIIAGGGAAGLSLACHLMQSPLRDRSILIVEQETKDQNDRTWCFWAAQPTLFDSIISRSWDQLQVISECFSKTMDVHPYRYNLIRGIDFYRFAHQTLAVAPQIDFLQGHIDGIEDGGKRASVLVNGQRYAGTWVFDSLFNWSAFHPDQVHYHYLRQQFKGWEIETPAPAFTPQALTFMDFRTSQEQGAHFLYVLPFSERHALVESVLCTAIPVSWENCEQAVGRYLESVLGINTYCIKRKEQGMSPLTDSPFPRQIGKRVLTIGVQGGRVKPSTGYAFLRIQRDSSAVVRSLLQTGHPFAGPPSPRRYRFFDSVLLAILAQQGAQAESIFTNLFKHNSVERIFRFLDETASLWENGRMVPSLPKRLLWQSFLQIVAARRV